MMLKKLGTGLSGPGDLWPTWSCSRTVARRIASSARSTSRGRGGIKNTGGLNEKGNARQSRPAPLISSLTSAHELKKKWKAHHHGQRSIVTDFLRRARYSAGPPAVLIKEKDGHAQSGIREDKQKGNISRAPIPAKGSATEKTDKPPESR